MSFRTSQRAAQAKKEAVTGVNSIFNLDVTNALGLDQELQKTKLKNFALQKPGDYAAIREEVYRGVVVNMIQNINNTVWTFLSVGQFPDPKTGDEKQIKVGGADWQPKMVDSEIASIANGLAKGVMDEFTKIFKEVIPDTFSTIGDQRLLNGGTV